MLMRKGLRKTSTVFLLAVAVVFALVLGFKEIQQDAGVALVSSNTKKVMFEPLMLDSNMENSHIVGLNDPLLLCSNEDRLGLADGYVAYFDWVGSMRVTLLRVAIYDSMEDAGIDSADLFYCDPSTIYKGCKMKFVLCDIVLENIDAEPDPFYGDSGYYNICSFRLAIEGISSTFIPNCSPLSVDYFDGTIPGATPHQLYYYSLDKGEAKQFRLGYFVDEVDLFKPSAFCIGINATPPADVKYQIRFAMTLDMLASRNSRD